MFPWLRSNKLSAVMIIIALAAVSSAVWNWYHPWIRTVSQTVYQPVQQEKIVEKIKRVSVPGPERVITIEKQAVVDKLDIHPIAENVEVIANADMPASDSGTSVVTVLNMDTGEATIIAKEKPQSLFGFPSNIEAGVRYGLSTQSAQEGDVFARWQFLRVGKAYLGAYAEVTTRPEAKGMLEASWRF